MNSKILSVVAIVGLAGFIGWWGVSEQLAAPVAQQGEQVEHQVQPTPKPPKAAAPTESPNFDTRLVEQAATQKPAAEAEPQAVASVEEQEQALQLVIQDYNAALNDPAAKKAFETKFKAQSAEYKKAILAKLKRDEL